MEERYRLAGEIAFYRIIEKLGAGNIQGHYAANREEARHIALGLISPGSIVAMGNSATLRETGIFDALVSGDFKVINQFEPGISPEENLRRRKLGLTADVYFTSTNALTLNGQLVNADGKGNRVAAMLFGPDRVIIVAGKNKIVEDLEAAWRRLRTTAAPRLAAKLGRNTPCAKTGMCADCFAAERICRFYTVIASQMPADKDRIHVIIVDEELGL